MGDRERKVGVFVPGVRKNGTPGTLRVQYSTFDKKRAWPGTDSPARERRGALAFVDGVLPETGSLSAEVF